MNDTKPLFIYIVMLFVAPRIAFKIWLKGFGAMKHNVSAMSSGGFRTTHYQNTTNEYRKHKR